MTHQETVAALRLLHGNLVEYGTLLHEILPRGQDLLGNVPMSQATSDERRRLAELRAGMAVLYGRVRTQISEASGGITHLQSFGQDRGDVFGLAFADPAGHPMLLRSLDAATQLTGTALGHFEHLLTSGAGAAEDAPRAEPAKEEAELAANVLRRLESDERLAAILPPARRLMVLANRPATALWLLMEEVGILAVGKDRPEPESEREWAYQTFMRLHSAADPDAAIDAVSGGRPQRSVLRKDVLLSASIAQLERSEPPEPLVGPVYDHDVGRQWLRAKVTHDEGWRVVERVRTELHQHVTSFDSELRLGRRRQEMFGNDHRAVFETGGPLLSELANCPATLDRTGAYLAAQEARTALMRLGRELYRGAPEKHVSPFNGKTYRPKTSEMHSLYALIGDLFSAATQPERKAMLTEAMRQAARAYELGSKAKTPTAITHDEAVEAIQLTFRVARALAFNGAFPLST